VTQLGSSDADGERLTSDPAILKAFINDLLAVVTLPALWRGAEPAQVARSLVDAVVATLGLDFAYVRMEGYADSDVVEAVRLASHDSQGARASAVSRLLAERLGAHYRSWPSLARIEDGAECWNVVICHLGWQGDGVLVAGSHRPGFPTESERLLLSVTANQAAMGLQEARALHVQRRLAEELDCKVAQRTSELQRSEALLAETQRLSCTGSFTCRPQTGEVAWSEQTYRIFGIERGTRVDMRLLDERLRPEGGLTFGQQLELSRASTGGVDFDGRLETDVGTTQYVHVIARVSQMEPVGLEYTGSIQDVTEKRLAQESLANASRELAEVARFSTLGVLAASIAHEVNQPLTGVLTNADTCLRMLGADPPNAHGAMIATQRLVRDGNRAAEVVRGLRALFRKRASAKELVDLNEAASEVIALSAVDLQRSRVVVRTEFEECLPLVHGDRVQLQQVMLNLVRNAADAMHRTEGTARNLLLRTESLGEGSVRLCVRDSGEGFLDKSSERLFEPFYTTKSEGMGIGLSISRSIIEHHDGQLWATNNEDGGATFWFSIPVGAPVDNQRLIHNSPV